MNKQDQHGFSDEIDHSIIERPYEYQIVELTYHVDLEDPLSSYIDLTLAKSVIARHLRFWGPQGLEI